MPERTTVLIPGVVPGGTATAAVKLPVPSAVTVLSQLLWPHRAAMETAARGRNPEPLTVTLVPGTTDQLLTSGTGAEPGPGAAVVEEAAAVGPIIDSISAENAKTLAAAHVRRPFLATTTLSGLNTSM
jgi:hypothetical protein